MRPSAAWSPSARRAGDRSEPAHPAHPRAGSARSPRLVLFDLDDTLCDYATARAERLRIAFGQALAAVHAREVRATGLLRRGREDADRATPRPDLDALIEASIAIHPHGADHFPDLLRPYGVSAEAAALAVAWYRANRFHGLTLFADAIATIEAVRASLPGRRLGLITNGPAEVQRDKIERLGLVGMVDFALISGEVGIEKPDPAIFHEALRRGDATAAEAIFVGDSPDHDIPGARAAGIRAVWINRTGRPWPATAPAPAEEIRDLRALLDLLGDATAAGA